MLSYQYFYYIFTLNQRHVVPELVPLSRCYEFSDSVLIIIM